MVYRRTFSHFGSCDERIKNLQDSRELAQLQDDCRNIKKEKRYYEANADEYAGVENREQRFVERVEAIISMENTLWMALHQRRESNRRTESD